MPNFSALTPADFKNPDYSVILALYTELLHAPLSSDTLPAFLADLHNLDVAADEAATRAQIAHDLDTNDASAKTLRDLWMADILPKLSDIKTQLDRRVLAIPGAPASCAIAFAQWDAAAKYFRPENIPLEAAIAELGSQYDNLIGSLVVNISGQEMTLPGANKELESPDREYRERVWRAIMASLKTLRPQLEPLWARLFQLRSQIAHNSGFANYRDYDFAHDPNKGYGPNDSASFYHAVATAARPILAEIRETRRLALGVDTLRPWDLAVDYQNKAPLDLGADSKKILNIAKAILAKVNPAVGVLLRQMESANLLDLDNRPGKAPGGYNTSLTYSKVPFVFMNAVGQGQDLQTIVHEMGHAVHADQVLNSIPFYWAQHPGFEMCEVASMAMELMSFEHLTPATTGLTNEEAIRLKADHLEDILSFFARCTTMDQLQHDLYLNPDGASLATADATFVSRHQGVDAGIDWSGLEDLEHLRWHHQSHVWVMPFYYLQYGLAQLASLNLWQKYQQNPDATFTAYTKALRLGHTKTLPELFKACGTSLDFSPEYMAPLLANALRSLKAYRQQLQPTPRPNQPARPRPLLKV